GAPFATDDEEEINVEQPREKRLKIEIQTGTQRRPGEELAARVRVTDDHGRPVVAQVTLWAVDEGVVELEPFSVPSIASYFGDERWSSVVTSDTRKNLLWERGPDGHQSRAPKVR